MFRSILISKPTSLMPKRLSKNRSSLQPALSSPSTPSPQPTAQSRMTLLKATMPQNANLLKCQFHRKAPCNTGINSTRGKKVYAYNCRGEGHVARQCPEPKRKMDSQYFKDKALLMEAKEKGDVLDAEAEAFSLFWKCTAPLMYQPHALTTTNIFQAIDEVCITLRRDEGPKLLRAPGKNLLDTDAEDPRLMTIRSRIISIFLTPKPKMFPTEVSADTSDKVPLPKCDQQALETDRIQLKDTITPLDTTNGLKEKTSLPAKSAIARRVEAHPRTLNKKNRVDSNLLVKHSVFVSHLNNVHDACNKSLDFANRNDCLVLCDDSVNVKPHQTKRFKRQPKKEWKPIKNVGNPIKRVWKPISKPVANNKPQWKPTGRHFSLFEKYPLTRIMEPTDMPIELPPSASSSPQITMVSRFTDHKLSDRQAGSKGISDIDRDQCASYQLVEKFIGTVRYGNELNMSTTLAMVIINWVTLSSLESIMLKDSSTTYSQSDSFVMEV
ncbi:reverse transcriptase domain-containing protein [Tanacetum coccineum]